jgi:tetratricopeptide (TPR) repeat protein
MLATLVLSICLGLAGEIVDPAQDNPLLVSEEMRQFLNSNIDRNTDSLQQLNTLVRLVFQQNALNFTYVPETRTASETFGKRGGNCVSFTFLFLAMARELGLDARYREVDIVPIWSRVGNIVSMSGHANAVVYVGRQGYIVDLFPRLNPLQLGGRVVSDQRAVAHFLSNRAVDHLAQGRSQTAILYFQKALESDPTAAFAWANLGVAQSVAGNLKEAEGNYLRAIKENPSELVAMSNLAGLYERLGREHDAQAYEAKVRKFKLRNPYYHFSLGLQAFDSGEYRGALEHLKTALKLKPSEHNFYLAMAKAYVQLGEMDKASANLKLALKTAPDEASKTRYSEKLSYLASLQSRS